MSVSKRRQVSGEEGICQMSDDIIGTRPDPSGVSPDPLTEVIRDRARKLLAQAIEAELAMLPTAFTDDRLEDCRARLVRPVTCRSGTCCTVAEQAIPHLRHLHRHRSHAPLLSFSRFLLHDGGGSVDCAVNGPAGDGSHLSWSQGTVPE